MTQVGHLKAQVIHADWYRSLAKYEKPDTRKAVGQLCNTLIPYFGLWILMVSIVQRNLSLWFLAPLILLASGLLVRIFIFFHDCGHGSFLPSHLANRIIGNICGILTFTPYDEWRLEHAEHHASAGDLERRGVGDILTLTVEEYKAASPLKKLGYRLFRNPIVLFVIGPPFQFMVMQRFPPKDAKPRQRNSVIFTNLALVLLFVVMSLTIGLRTYLLIQLPIITIAGIMGVWMFYVQHQYDHVYWAHHQEWDPIKAALDGSSYYKLPVILQWFSGNIGLHHIHHLKPRIANYHLQKCFDEVPELQNVEPLTLWKSFHCIRLNLWDEAQQRLVSFRALRTQ